MRSRRVSLTGLIGSRYREIAVRLDVSWTCSDDTLAVSEQLGALEREGAGDQLYGGWMMILSTLKTLLETGESLDTSGSLMAGDAR